MRAWLEAIGTWAQGWLSADAGLAGLFASALASATLLPGTSEVVLVALLTAYPGLAWPALLVATVGNVLGGALTFWMGVGARHGYERFQGLRFRLSEPALARLRRYGPPALFLSFAPVVGDALVLAAGWSRLPFAASLAWMTAGRAARYAVLVASMAGLMAWA
jgi:membrane protein YqaA with SNARE-associated domain